MEQEGGGERETERGGGTIPVSPFGSVMMSK